MFMSLLTFVSSRYGVFKIVCIICWVLHKLVFCKTQSTSVYNLCPVFTNCCSLATSWPLFNGCTLCLPKLYTCVAFLIISANYFFDLMVADKNFNLGGNDTNSSFHRSSSTPAFNSSTVNNGPLGTKGLRGGGGFKGNTPVPDNFISNMAQLSASTSKVRTFRKTIYTTWGQIPLNVRAIIAKINY